MAKSLKEELELMALEQISKSPIGEKMKKAVQVFQTVQNHYFAIEEKVEEGDSLGLKAATIAAFAILAKIASGKQPRDFEKEDWVDIAGAISQKAILLDGQSYSIFIFNMYEKYIRTCAKMLCSKDEDDEKKKAKVKASADLPAVPKQASSDITQIKGQVGLNRAAEKVLALADELHEQEKKLKCGKIGEVTYTEECLWICLEAMVKLLTSTVALAAGDSAVDLAEAIADYAFEYGRLAFYKREQEMVTRFLESQRELDSDLEIQYADYLAEVNKRSEEFHILLDNAFAPDFRTAFLQSILLARAAGVKEEEILSSAQDIDEFFLS